jgi:hypothetical protein
MINSIQQVFVILNLPKMTYDLHSEKEFQKKEGEFNEKHYHWYADDYFKNQTKFKGQDVTHLMPIPALPEYQD